MESVGSDPADTATSKICGELIPALHRILSGHDYDPGNGNGIGCNNEKKQACYLNMFTDQVNCWNSIL